MKILVACEESQRVCKAFRAKGHEAYSCDIIMCFGVTNPSYQTVRMSAVNKIIKGVYHDRQRKV